MRNQDQRRMGVGIELEQQLADPRARDGVEIAGGLVREQHRRLRHERPGERDALLLSARELPRVVAGALLEPDALQGLCGRAPRIPPPANSSGNITFSSAVSAGIRWKD